MFSTFSNRIKERIGRWQHLSEDLPPTEISWREGIFSGHAAGANWTTVFSFDLENKKIIGLRIYVNQKILSPYELSILDLAAECCLHKNWDSINPQTLREVQHFLKDGHGAGDPAPSNFQWSLLEAWLDGWRKSRLQTTGDYTQLGRTVNQVLHELKLEKRMKLLHLEMQPFVLFLEHISENGHSIDTESLEKELKKKWQLENIKLHMTFPLGQL
ncbi:MAG: hypothetical protein QE271_08385 [Bacteriovoracaceae bacterium]|nr:hypothetical protein [Bacteriovoracaceae bacterium]